MNITEKVSTVEYGNRHFTVYINNPVGALENVMRKTRYFQARVLALPDGSVYMWDADEELHDIVGMYFGLEKYEPGYLNFKDGKFSLFFYHWQHVHVTGYLQRLMTHWHITKDYGVKGQPQEIVAHHHVRGKSLTEFLGEAKIETIGPYGYNFQVYQNPNVEFTLGFIKKTKYGEVRYLVDPDGVYWLWDSDKAIHLSVARELGYEYDSLHHIGFINKKLGGFKIYIEPVKNQDHPVKGAFERFVGALKAAGVKVSGE